MFIYVTYGMPLAEKEMPKNLFGWRRHDVLTKSWEDEHLFDSESHYMLEVTNIPELTPFQRFLARTIYNPVVPISANWQRVGEFNREDLIKAVEKGLETDDDCIQQWFEGKEIVQLLRAAKDWEELLLAAEAITGAHESELEVAEYVDQKLKTSYVSQLRNF